MVNPKTTFSERESNYLVLGLDIGIGSCGWCILDKAHNIIVDMGVRLWSPPQENKTKASLASTRRAARSSRRNCKRTKDRKKHCFELFKAEGIAPSDAEANWVQTKAGEKPTIKLRAAGLNRKLSSREWAQVLYSLCSRRGYIPHGESNDDSEGKAVIAAIKTQQEKLDNNEFRTVGELLANGTHCRNHSGDYSLCVSNNQVKNEVAALFKAQRKLGNKHASETFEQQYLECLTWQKSVTDHDEIIYSKVGPCTYFKQEKRAADSCLSSEMCKAFESICHVTYVDSDGAEGKLPPDIRQRAVDVWFSPTALPKNKDCKVKYSDLRSWLKAELCIGDDFFFKGVERDDENSKEPFKPSRWRNQRKQLSPSLMLSMRNNRHFADGIDSALTYASSKESLQRQLNELPLSEADIEELCSLSYSSRLYSGYGMRSLKALDLLIESFESDEVSTLAEAEKASGLLSLRQSSSAEKGLTLPPYIAFDPTCTNPVVLRVMGQVRKVINACIAEYGPFDEVHIELARELKQSAKEKDAILRSNNKTNKNREVLRKKLAEELSRDEDTIPLKLLEKVELWNQQDGRDLYVDEPIQYERLISDDTYCEIDHILPYSRTCDDSRMNKILVLQKSNQNKRESTPFEWMSATGDWDNFKLRILRLAHYPQKKKQRLLNTDLAEKQPEFIARNLNDTRYASLAAKRYIEEYLTFKDNGKSRHVIAVAGGATAALRNAWGIRKDRSEDNLHHAVDASIIAACDESTVIAIAKASERKALTPKDKRKELFSRTEPWQDFANEVLSRKEHIIPSFMTDHKVSGRIFEDTVYRFDGYNEAGTKGILTATKEGMPKSKPSGNYIVRDDGSAVIPDGLAFLRLWWDPTFKVRKGKEPGCYIPEPVFLSDLPKAFDCDYIPLIAPPQKDKKPREKWDGLSEELRNQKPVVLFRNDAIAIGSTVRRFAGFDIDGCSWTLLDPLGKMSQKEATKGLRISSIGPKTRFSVIHEDPLGKCFAPFLED